MEGSRNNGSVIDVGILNEKLIEEKAEVEPKFM